MAFEFEWDPQKAAANLKKHGVTLDEASTVFGDPLARLVDDPDHSEDEERFVLFSRSAAGRLLAVMHSEHATVLRLISAREMTPREKKQYAQFQP